MIGDPTSVLGEKVAVTSPNAPQAIGPYSQAVKIGSFIFCSGQIPIDPKTGQVVGSDIAQQTERVLQNLSAILDATGSGLFHVVKTTVYLKSLADFDAMNAVYAKHFMITPPARATVEVSRLPKDVLVEIECIAIQPHRDIQGAKAF